jgi:hypothetical protein
MIPFLPEDPLVCSFLKIPWSVPSGKGIDGKVRRNCIPVIRQAFRSFKAAYKGSGGLEYRKNHQLLDPIYKFRPIGLK